MIHIKKGKKKILSTFLTCMVTCMVGYLYKSSFHSHKSPINPDWGVKIVRN